MTGDVWIRTLAADDIDAYKALRDRTLADHPSAFTSDAEQERQRPASVHRGRLEAQRADGGHFTLGAWHGERLVGALSCERETRLKAQHVAHLAGMMVASDQQGRGLGHALLEQALALARRAAGLELLTLSVTDGNTAAIRLYERAGFIRYGTLPRAILVAGRYHAKHLMVLTL